ncbi:P-type conjugative transfer protein TrbL [Pelagibacterium luteolum]|uniref:Type IV secretion system protein TrbL n=1 Tax=Pelagibacterium luteolum TaxID=440168 RepID=A0A1G7YII9_9HYPH|nr:P-type conjugative transfer protein TrbL [Pelagibacterium luteolum]SDG96194.1 type IV secretion system protein TrbL [Pelagibacterium luteolum]
MNNTGVIDRFLDTFTTYIDSGFGLLGGEIAFLTTTLIVIDITLAGLFWAWGADEDVIQRLMKKTLYIGFFAFIIGNFNGLAQIVFQSFSGLGLLAGGSQITADELLRPGAVAQTGLDAAQPLLDSASQLLGFPAVFFNLVQIVVLLVAWIIVLIAFFVLSVQIFVTLVEFKLTTLAGFVLIPFALFNKTAFLAEKVLGNIVASGVKILVLAVIVGIGSGLFNEFTQGFGGDQPTISDAMALVLAALALMGLSIFGPGIATGLVSGAPQLGAGAAAGTGLAVAGIGAASFMGGRALAGAVPGAARGLATAGGAASSAYSIGAETSGKTGPGAIPGGVGGMIGAGGALAGQGMRALGQRAVAPLREGAAAGANTVRAAAGQSTPNQSADAAGAAAGASGQPEWARRMHRSQTMSHGVTTAAHVVRSGDSGGGGASVSLQQDDR